MRSLLSLSGAIAARCASALQFSDQKFNKNPSLGWLLIVPFVLQTAVATGLTGILTFWNGQQAVHTLATQLHTETTLRIQEHLHAYLSNTSLINQINANGIRLKQLDVSNWDAMQYHFAAQLSQFKAVTSISFANEKGDLLGVQRLSNGELRIGLARQTLSRNVLYLYAADQEGDRGNLLQTIPNFVLQERPWYRAAVGQTEPIWTPVYSWLGGKADFGITAAQTVRSPTGGRLGVLSVSLDLTAINRFLQNTQKGHSGQTFILERSGAVVASSFTEPSSAQAPPNRELQPLQAAESKTPLIQVTSQHLIERFGNFHNIRTSQQLNLDIESKRHYIQVTPFRDSHGLDWLIVVAVPESEFIEQINSNTRMSILLSIGALTVTLLLGIMLSRRVACSIRNLSEASQKIADGDLAQRVDQQIPVPELATLAQSFNQMSQELQQSRQQLEDYSRSLERNVAERTQELEAEIKRRTVIETVLHNANQELQRMAFVDGLTQVANRRYLDEILCQEWWRARRSQLPLSLILCDVDYFKQYNDSYGHQAGDDCLRRIAAVLRLVVRRPADLVARYGGEEFVLVLPDTQIQGAIQVAQEIQAEMQRLQMPHIGSKINPHVTLSLGVASVIPKVGASASQLVGAADRSLYQAKAKGRNCIVAHEIDRSGNKNLYELKDVHIA